MFNEIDYYEVFGVEPKEEPGAKEQEAAEPAKVSEPRQGAKEQDLAEPAVDDDAPEAKEEEAKDGAKEQDAHENAKYAALRREAEKTAKRQFERERDRDIASLDIKDESGKKIDSYESLVKHLGEKKQTESREKEAEVYTRLIEAGFEADEAKALSEASSAAKRLESLERDLSEMKAREQRELFSKKVAEELEIIASYEPEVKSVEDLSKMENFEAFRQYVEEGESFLSAYLRANKTQIRKLRAQEHRERPAEKDHLSQTKTRGSGAVDVPESVIAEYRVFNPTATRAEIIAHYRKNHKEK